MPLFNRVDRVCNITLRESGHRRPGPLRLIRFAARIHLPQVSHTRQSDRTTKVAIANDGTARNRGCHPQNRRAETQDTHPRRGRESVSDMNCEGTASR